MIKIEEETLANYSGGSLAACIGGIAAGGLLGIRVGSWFGPTAGIICGLIGAGIGAAGYC